MRSRWIAAGAALVLVAGGLVWLVARDREGPAGAARAYLDAWGRSDYATMSSLALDPRADFAAVHRELAERLRVVASRFDLVRVERRGSRDTALFTARLALSGLGEWPYRGRLALVRREGRWLVDWTPAALHPRLGAGRRLGRVRTWPERAPILARDGTPITSERPVVVVGMEPRRVLDRGGVKTAVARYLDVDPARVDTELDRPGVRPDWFLPLIEVRDQRFRSVERALRAVPGLVFRNETARLTPSEGFARHAVGRTGEITKELLDRMGEPYRVGDRVGRSGLELAFERRLAGRPAGEVRLIDGDGATVEVLHRFEGDAGRPVRTTLDLRMQRAVEDALTGVTKPAGVVLIDANTGEIRAVASRPLDQPFNRALAGRYPPGSTFKIVTAAALLASGVTPDRTVPCPRTVEAGGKTFRNYEGNAFGDIPFRRAFTLSCNTAFVSLARGLSSAELRAAAERVGFGAAYPLPLPVAGGRFPEPADDVEKVAAAIGQARVEASPVHMASVAAAVAGGAWRPPVLTLPAEGERAPRPLSSSVAEALRSLMRLVVAEGTGRAARLAGEPVAGKTGTAEFGPGPDPDTHAWFVGYRGSLAFAVVVEGAGVGGRVAAPIAATFLRAIERGAA